MLIWFCQLLLDLRGLFRQCRLLSGKDIALANKETLVTAGNLFMEAIAENNVRLLPVDSEHSAIFQSMLAGNHREVKKILLTASGGPFLERRELN